MDPYAEASYDWSKSEGNVAQSYVARGEAECLHRARNRGANQFEIADWTHDNLLDRKQVLGTFRLHMVSRDPIRREVGNDVWRHQPV